MKKRMTASSSIPLYEKVEQKEPLYRVYVYFHIVLMLWFIWYRFSNPLEECYSFWVVAFLCENWFAFMWILYHNMRWLLVDYKPYPERLRQRYGGENASNLPAVDIIITTTDPLKEPAIITANTILSVLAVDYPVENFACYVSDDGASPITFYSLVETLNFAKKWVPFCKEYNIQLRAPLMYFSKETKQSDPNCLQEILYLKDEYESLNRKINKALEMGEVPLESMCPNLLDGFVHRSSDNSNHPSIVQIIYENNGDTTNEALPHLIYVAREKRPKVDHHYKAGAMNVMARVSAVMTNAPFILNLDCDMHISNPKVIQQAMCFFLGCPEKEFGFVQFPQLFYDAVEDDPFGGQHKVFFTNIFKGLNEIQGPLYAGTCCFHRRKGLYGVPPPAPDKNAKRLEKFDDQGIKKTFGESCALVEAAKAIVRDGYECLRSSTPSLAEEEALKVASCRYEANTAWGKEVGWMYGSTVEDLMTGLKVHSLGWHSVYCIPEQPAFMGCAPDNGPDSFVQKRRWATGMLEILFSRLSPFICKSKEFTLRQRMFYAYCTLNTLSSLAALGYSLLPAFSLLSGRPFLPMLSEPALLVAVALFMSGYGYRLSEYLWSGCSVNEWWNNQRMWLISNLSSSLFACFDVWMKLIGFSQTVFVLTPKGCQDDGDDDKGDFTFTSSSLFIPPTTVLLLNLGAIIHSIFCFVGGRYEIQVMLFMEFMCSVWVVINLWPFVKGLVRKRKHGLPWTVVIKSGALAMLLWRTLA